MNKKTKWILISATLLVVLLVVLSKLGVFGKEEGVKVTAEESAKRTIIEVVNASGKVYPEIEVKISPDISGEITELYVQEGDTVKSGQLLARIYADIYSIQRDQANYGVEQSRSQVANAKASLDALQAQMDQAQKAFDMQEALFKDKVISKNEFNTAEAALKSAKANYEAGIQSIKGVSASVQSAQASLNRANKDLGRTAIIAPMDGVVSLLNVKKGEKVAGNSFNIGTEMLRIANMDKIEVRVDVGENDIPKVKLGDSAVVTIDAYSDKKFKGIVTQIASSNTGASSSGLTAVSNDVTQYKVYIRLIKESYMDMLGKGSFPFRPGMSASADIQTLTKKDVISVPINSVTVRDPEMEKNKTEKDDEESDNVGSDAVGLSEPEVILFVLDKNNIARKKKVTTGIQDTKYIEILTGINNGEKVITGPYETVSKTLMDSTKVKVVDRKALFEDNKK
jgi:HlyD family secretion protein